MAENWKVSNQRQTRAMLDGVFQDAMEVTFTTADNHVGSVTIPLKSYNAATAKQAIDARVAQLDAVNAL